jgi:hypothetical protein
MFTMSIPLVVRRLPLDHLIRDVTAQWRDALRHREAAPAALAPAALEHELPPRVLRCAYIPHPGQSRSLAVAGLRIDYGAYRSRVNRAAGAVHLRISSWPDALRLDFTVTDQRLLGVPDTVHRALRAVDDAADQRTDVLTTRRLHRG